MINFIAELSKYKIPVEQFTKWSISKSINPAIILGRSFSEQLGVWLDFLQDKYNLVIWCDGVMYSISYFNYDKEDARKTLEHFSTPFLMKPIPFLKDDKVKTINDAYAIVILKALAYIQKPF